MLHCASARLLLSDAFLLQCFVYANSHESGRHATTLSVRSGVTRRTAKNQQQSLIDSEALAMNITTRQLKAFVLTARHQSFSRAAEELFITQSGMSVLVRELETQLGFRLFERTTRKVMLTDPGAMFLPVAERSLRELETAALHLSRAAAGAGDCLAVGA